MMQATLKLLRFLAAVVLASACGFCAPLYAGTTAPPAKSELTNEDLEGLKTLFGKMADGFNKGDVNAILALLANQKSSRHDKLAESLEREFQQFHYSEFTIVSISPDDTITPRRHSVDVTMRMRLEDVLRPKTQDPDHASADPSTTTERFLVQSLDDGSFALVDSSYFDKLGLRQGMGMVVDALLAVMALVAALAFWVWMGFEAYRERPRSTVWRLLVYGVPVIGALAYFVARYVPAQLRPSTIPEH